MRIKLTAQNLAMKSLCRGKIQMCRFLPRKNWTLAGVGGRGGGESVFHKRKLTMVEAKISLKKKKQTDINQKRKTDQ